jgi:hypothetical protein
MKRLKQLDVAMSPIRIYGGIHLSCIPLRYISQTGDGPQTWHMFDRKLQYSANEGFVVISDHRLGLVVIAVRG